MHKKLAGDLTSIAHSILQMKDKQDVFALRQKAHELYEKLSVLAYVEEYINNTPNPSKTKEELLADIEAIEESKIKLVSSEVEMIQDDVVPDFEVEAVADKDEQSEEDLIEEEVPEEPGLFEPIKDEIDSETASVSEVIQQSDQEVEESIDEIERVELEEVTLEDELKDTLAVDVAADLFEKTPKKSLNDKLLGDIQIGLNDRIAFVSNLFDGSQEDFNRVVSQLNTFKTMGEAKKFINKVVKPDYDWSQKQDFEERFMTIVERKFV